MRRPILPACEQTPPDPSFGYTARSAPPVLRGGQPSRSEKISKVRKRFASSRVLLPQSRGGPHSTVKDHILVPLRRLYHITCHISIGKVYLKGLLWTANKVEGSMHGIS